MTPACEMVDRAPGDGQHWMKMLHPMKPMVAVRLKPRDSERDLAKALKEAEQTRTLFLSGSSGMLAFDVLPDGGGPSYEFVYVQSGSLALAEGCHQFSGYRLLRVEDEALPTALTPVIFTVIGQVRPDYASRFLQQTGAWLSRIGVDFVRAVT